MRLASVFGFENAVLSFVWGSGILVPWETGGAAGRRWAGEDGAWAAVSHEKAQCPDPSCRYFSTVI